MKRIAALLLAAVMIVSLPGCGGNNADTASKATEIARGTIKDGVYSNDVAGIAFTAPEGYAFFSDEEIAEAFGITIEYLELDEVNSIIYDMYCYNEEKQSSININFEDLTQRFGSSIEEQEYIESCMTGYSITFNSFEDVRMESIESSVIEISGVEFNCINLILDNDGKEFYETLVVKKLGSYMMTCTVAAYTQEEMNNITAAVTAL